MKNGTPFVSIIIPVYNGLQHGISNCLNSIWKQALESNELEVICVDDCSRDNTLDFLNEEASERTNMKVVKTKNNLRQGGARNLGIKVATGNYIMFVDQDDYFSEGAIKAVLNHLIGHDLDTLICDSAWQVRGRESRELQLNFNDIGVVRGVDFIVNNGIVHAPWKFVVKRNILLDFNIFFQEDVRMEDLDWSLRVTNISEKMQYLPLLLIHHNRGIGSTTFDSYKNVDTICDTVKMAERVFVLGRTIFKEHKLASEKVGEIADFYFNHALRFMFGVNGNFATKKACLVENIPKGHVSNFSLVKLAQFSPGIFSLLTIVGCPFFRILLSLYRKAKY